MAALPDLSQAKEVLIIKPSSLGDVVHTLPAVHLLKQRWPHLNLTWLVNPEFAPILEGNPDLHRVLHFPRSQFRGLAGLGRFRTWLRELPGTIRPDAALDFQGLLRSGLIARASRAPHTTGLTDSREGSRFFHHTRVPVNAAGHAVERYLALARALGADGAAAFPLPCGTPPERNGTPLSDASIPPDLILLHPFSRGEGKSMSAAQVQAFCQAAAPHPVWIVGRTPDAGALVLPGNAESFLNTTSLSGLIWLLRRAAAVVSVDSGPMHIAAALTPDVLSLHTWSDPRRVGPWRPDAWVWKDGALCRAGEYHGAGGTSGSLPDNAIPRIAAWARERVSRAEPAHG